MGPSRTRSHGRTIHAKSNVPPRNARQTILNEAVTGVVGAVRVARGEGEADGKRAGKMEKQSGDA